MPILEKRVLWFIIRNISIAGVQIISNFFCCNVYVYISGRRLKLINANILLRCATRNEEFFNSEIYSVFYQLKPTQNSKNGAPPVFVLQ
jgi:hypothetical protein